MTDRPEDEAQPGEEAATGTAAEDVYSDEEEDEVEQRLRDLGYL